MEDRFDITFEVLKNLEGFFEKPNTMNEVNAFDILILRGLK
jgi:hypothetical protein